MITSINNMHSKGLPSLLSFKAYDGKSRNIPSQNPCDLCDHYTAFFRNSETLEFVKDYALEEFPQGTHLAGFGIANGDESHSLMMYFNEYNQDKKYTYTGYDVAQREINLAKKGPFTLKTDLILDPCLWEDDAKLKHLFDSCFEEVSAADSVDQNQIPIKNLQDGFFISPSQPHVYMPKREFVNGVLDFQVGDVHDISKILKPDGKTGVVIFKNAWYMVMGITKLESCQQLIASGGLAPVEKIIEDVHKILPKNGIFVVGNLKIDHLYDGINGSERLIHQKGQRIKVCDNTPFHVLLRKHGFIPIFYEHIKGVNEFPDRMMVALPSVWKKV